jgi:hypothetical protein
VHLRVWPINLQFLYYLLVGKANILSQVHAAGISYYKEHGKAKDKSTYWIIMERLHGLSLDHLFDERNPLPETEVIKVGKLICTPVVTSKNETQALKY